MTLKELGLLLLGVMALTIATLSYYSLHEYKKTALDKQQISQLGDQLKAAQMAAERQQKVQTVTNQVVAKATLQTQQTTLKTQEISHKVDVITGKVKDDQISDAAADAAYVSSMLEAYCEAVPTDRSKCPAGQSN